MQGFDRKKVMVFNKCSHCQVYPGQFHSPGCPNHVPIDNEDTDPDMAVVLSVTVNAVGSGSATRVRMKGDSLRCKSRLGGT